MDLAVPVDVAAWLGLAVLFGIVEIFTIGFFFMFFAVGALITALVSFGVHSLPIQILVFVVSSIGVMLLARPLLKEAFRVGDKPLQDSNVSALVGAEVQVLENIDQYTGRVKVTHTGETWSAYLAQPDLDQPMSSGEAGIIEKVDGAKLAIRRKPEE